MNNYDKKLNGCRFSKNRENVIKIFENITEPASAENIFDIFKRTYGTISLSTIYRIIDKLVSSKILRKAITLDDNRARYELEGNEHHHFMICTHCHKMFPIDVCPVEELEKIISKKSGFNITGHKFELYGECSSCLTKKQNDKF